MARYLSMKDSNQNPLKRVTKFVRNVWEIIIDTNKYRQNQLSRSHWEKWKCKYQEYKFSCSVPFPRAIGRGNYLEEGDLKLMHTLHNQLYSLHCPTKQKYWKAIMFYISLAIFLLILLNPNFLTTDWEAIMF